MKAAIVEAPGVLQVRDVPEPRLQSDYDVLCELLFGATCTGTDQTLIAGKFPFGMKYPMILGHESIGRVVEVGSKVRGFARGNLVTRVGAPSGLEPNLGSGWGGFAEMGIAKDHQAMREDGLPYENWNSFRVNQLLPPDVCPAAATMMITWRETYSYILRLAGDAESLRGASVLVIGSGGNGLAFAAHAANAGAARVAVVGHIAREEVARRAGASEYFDYKTTAASDLVSNITDDGFDILLDVVGKRDSASSFLPALKRGGRMGIYGVDDYAAIRLDPTSARGSFSVCDEGYDEAEVHAPVLVSLQNGALDANLWFDTQAPFELNDILAAFDSVRERRAVKALIKLSK